MARLHQLLLALVFLTRLPLGRLLPARILPLKEAAWAFPLAGAVVGAVGALPLLIWGTSLLTACLSVALMVWFTGALHEDALADFTDAAGGQDQQTRLRIMRDSHIGSYGTMALILATALRIAALASVSPLALIAAAACGRAAILPGMILLPPARGDGLGRDAGRPSVAALLVALTLAALALSLAGPGAPGAAIAGVVAAAWVIARARKWLGGQTGDVLGTLSLAVETVMLIAFALGDPTAPA